MITGTARFSGSHKFNESVLSYANVDVTLTNRRGFWRIDMKSAGSNVWVDFGPHEAESVRSLIDRIIAEPDGMVATSLLPVLADAVDEFNDCKLSYWTTHVLRATELLLWSRNTDIDNHHN